MINTASLEVLAERLRVYDVDQAAWEQEPNGFEANASHVLTHLAKDLVGKNFADANLVRTAIAPDSVQYGLRLARWSGIPVADLVRVTGVEEDIRNEVEESFDFRKLPWGFASFAGGMRTLAIHLHDIDHQSERDDAMRYMHTSMRSASRLLINSASIQAHQLDFSLTNAFNDRLAFLRNRFGIPQPQDN
jgi:hypothetical protein